MSKVKKTHWLRTTILVLLVCGIAGLALAVVQFNRSGQRTYAAATLQFSFRGAAEGTAPSGNPFDVSGLTSDTVLEDALKAAGLEEKYTAEQLRDNLLVTGVYPENIVRQMTQYVSLLDTNADRQAVLSDYHATQYSVTLYNDFDPGIGQAELTGLLDRILEGYRAYFAETCSISLKRADVIPDVSGYDYPQQLAVISEESTQQRRLAEEMAELEPTFRLNGKGFDDIAVRYTALDGDIERLNAAITLNVLSKDRDRLQKQYEMEIRTMNISVASLQEELKQVEEQMTAYEKDSILYVSTSGALQQVTSNASATYDRLVARRKEIADSITETNAQLALYEARLADMAATAGESAAADAPVDDTAETAETLAAATELTEEEMEALRTDTEKRIRALTAKKNTIRSDFRAMLDACTEAEINEQTVSVSARMYRAPSLISGAFLVQAIKTAGPLCALGFMACMALLIIRRRKEEKEQKA